MAISNDALLNIDNWVQFATTAFMGVAGFYRYKKIGIPAKAFLWQCTTEPVLDNITDLFKFHNLSITPILYVSYFKNMLLMAIFLTYCVPLFKKIKIGWYFSIGCTLFWITNMLLFPSKRLPAIGAATLNINYLAEVRYMYFLSFFILVSITMSLAALYIMFQTGKWNAIKKNANFWLITVNMFMDSCSFINSSVLPMISTGELYAHRTFYNMLSFAVDWMPNYIGLVIFGIIFIVFPKKEGATPNPVMDTG